MIATRIHTVSYDTVHILVAASKRDSAYSTKAGFKYFVLGAVPSGWMHSINR